MTPSRAPLVIAALALVAIVQSATHGRRRGAPPPEPPAAIAIEARAPTGPHPRLLLDAPALARLSDAAKKRSPAWQRVRAACDKQLAETIRSGYEGFDWADAVADLALCWRGTGDRRFADGAVRYFTALLDDRYLVGDGQGGDLEVRHDDGYGIRSFGVFTALGYDWLHDAPSMTPALRARAVARLDAWLKWYGEKGYQREQPIANYFCGYLLAQIFAGLAVTGEAPEGERWLTFGRDTLLARRLLPAYAESLRGGDWPEGWQYGELSAAEVALAAEAMRTATGVELARAIPWLRQVVTHHVHALVPGSSAIYDNGDWSEHPARPSPLALTAIALALDPVDTAGAAEARWMTRHGLPDLGGERLWLELLAERDAGRERDPHLGAPLSYFLPGTGLSFMRSEWTPRAVWASFQAGPTLADHQHNDQGHFELWRGGDGLIVDGGNYGSAATASHNTLLVDDGGKHLNYSPNQGVWGRSMHTTRFFDGGEQVVTAGELTDAWLPGCVEDGCRARTVRAATRTLVFLRPSTLVIDDRVTVDEAGFGVAWAAHFTAAPELKWPRAGARVGGSRVDVQTVLPTDGKMAVRKEPIATGPGPYRQNEPWGPMWRLEVVSATGGTARRFLHVVTAGAAGDTPPAIRRLDGHGLSGALIPLARGAENLLFSDGDAGGSGEVDRAARQVLVVGLRPGAAYSVRGSRAGGKCLIEVRPSDTGPARADAGGALRLNTPACAPGT